MRKSVLLFGLVLGFLFLSVQPSSAVSVDLELALLVDVSGSIDATEFSIQKTGYVNAFNNTAVWTKIDQGAIGSIAATLVYWSSYYQQQQAVGWTLIDSQVAAQDFADLIDATMRPFNGNTGVQSALNFAATSLSIDSNGYEGTRQVIDISGDGVNNSGSGATLDFGRVAALAAGYDIINGLVIEAVTTNVVYNYYVNYVQAGTGSFVTKVDDFDDFGLAIQSKIIAEVGGEPIPEPATMLLLGSGLIGLAGYARKRFKK